jgi:galactose mutarotase-like enzyme
MKNLTKCRLIFLAPLLAVACLQPRQAVAQSAPLTVNGVPAVILKRPHTAKPDKPQFVEATVLPGAGMNLLQLKAYLPGSGEVNAVGVTSLEDAKKLLEEDNDAFGNKSFYIGGAILLPFPNRIRGTLSSDGKTIQTNIGGKEVSLPANWHGKNPGAQVHAMHGLIFASKFEDVKHQDGAASSDVSAILHAGDFHGHWPSKTDVSVHMTLSDQALDLAVTARNVGHELLPMAIGFHPYFDFPSGDRRQGRLHIPADQRAPATNYDDVFPTGQIVPVKGTPFDFTNPQGTPLGDLFMDDAFTDLQRGSDGAAHIEIIDPKAHYGLRILALSPQIKAIQVYAPPDKSYVAVEPQFNLADPFNKEVWGNRDTGVVWLKPNQSVTWHIKLELFVPAE